MRIAAAVFLLGVLVLVIWGVYAAYNSLEAEKTLHAYNVVADVVSAYLDEQEGQWPSDWDSLIAVKPSSEHGVWDWPEDSEEVIERLEIDFSLTTAQVAAMEVDSFGAIKQKGSHYGYNLYWTTRLLNVARHWDNVANQKVEAP